MMRPKSENAIKTTKNVNRNEARRSKSSLQENCLLKKFSTYPEKNIAAYTATTIPRSDKNAFRNPFLSPNKKEITRIIPKTVSSVFIY